MTQQQSGNTPSDPAFWEAKLQQDRLAPIEGGDTLGLPPEIGGAWERSRAVLGEYATRDALADATVSNLQASKIGIKTLGFTRWEHLKELLSEPDEIEKEIRGDLDEEVEAVIDESPKEPFEIAATVLLPHEIERLLAPLDERERQILALRFGLDRGEPRTLEEVGEYFKLDRNRIREIEAKAMCKLRHPNSPPDALDLLEIPKSQE